MAMNRFAVALGSNRRHGTHGAPAATVRAAIAEVAQRGLEIDAVSEVRATPALGPAGRSFANAAIVISTDIDPASLLSELKDVESSFGRRAGRRWGPRVLDLDILLWSGGAWEGKGIVVPHRAFRERAFVLDPLAEIAPDWRDPVTGATVRQLRARLAAPRPLRAKAG